MSNNDHQHADGIREGQLVEVVRSVLDEGSAK